MPKRLRAHWDLEERIHAGFWLLILLPFVFAWGALKTFSALSAAAAEVRHASTVTRRVELLQSNLKDLEIAQREYILTGDERFLSRFQEHKSRVWSALGELNASSLHEPLVSDNLKILNALISEHFEYLEKVVNARRNQGAEAALQVVLAGRGEQAIDNIRTISNQISTEEQRRLTDESASLNTNLRWSIFLLCVIMVANVGFAWLLFRSARREQLRMRELNLELERRVRERTEALRRSNEDLQQFAYVASHDLQEPLRIIAGYCGLLMRRYKGRLDQDADEFLHFMADAARRMQQLIQSLLEFSRVRLATDEPQEMVDLNRICQEALLNLQVKIEETQAEITQDPLPVAPGNPTRLLQVFQNLVGNALKYRSADRPPKIHIGVKTEGSQAVVFVSDNGMGIRREDAEKIFAPFQRLHGREYEGAGIGLAMCKTIIERMGGRIWVESEPGRGSTFFFTIPLAETARAAKA